MTNGLLAKNGIIVTGSIEVQNAVTASAFSGDGSALTNTPQTDISALNTFTGSIQTQVDILETATGSYATTSSVDTLIAATSSYLTSIPNTYLNTTAYTTETISKSFNYTSSLNIVEITSSIESAIIDYRLTNLNSGSRAGTFIYTHNGTDLNYVDSTVEGVGNGNNPILSATLTGSIVSIDIENAAGFNFSGFAKKFSKLNSAVPVATGNVSYPLDTYTGASAAYSLRQLRFLYTGSAISVRRTSDNTELDIGFDINGALDTTAISTHCGASNGYVVTWYDQSGNDLHLLQNTHGAQTLIYNGSSVLTENGKPILVGGYGYINNDYTSSATNTIFSVLKGNGDGTLIHDGGRMLISDFQTGVLPDYGFPSLSYYVDGQATSFASRAEVSASIQGNQRLVTVLHSDANSTYLQLGTNSTSQQHDMQELIIYPNQTISRTGLETEINTYYSIYDTGLIEAYSGASAAYSVRQLSTSATSSMNIRRASDNTEQVIGFTSAGDLDTGSIETFCAGTECYVDTWYDQSGNGNHAEQTSATKQPLIYSASAVITENNKPALNFDGSDDVLKKQFGSAIPQPGHVYITATNNTTNFNDYIVLFSGYNDANTRWQTEVRITTGYLSMYAGGSNTSTTVIGTTQSLHNNYYSGSDSDHRLNGTSIATGNAGTFSTDGLTIGARFNEIYHWDGTMQEFIIWPTSQSNAIETNINSYYNIY